MSEKLSERMRAPLSIANSHIIRAFADEVAALEQQLVAKEQMIAGQQKELHTVEQVLGQALGYPWYKDDQKNFPGSTEADGVCVGAHTPSSIADEASSRLATKDAEIARLRERMEQDADSWDEKNYGVETPKECSADYIYGYNAGCAETFRACAYRTSTIGAALAETPAQSDREKFLAKYDGLCPCCQNNLKVENDKGIVDCPYCVTRELSSKCV